jgi:hypothetical protein
LSYISKYVKKSFPEFTHGKCAVRSIAMKKEGLRKKRKIPMDYKEIEDDQDLEFK